VDFYSTTFSLFITQTVQQVQCKSFRSLRTGESFAASVTPGDLSWLEYFLTSSE